NDIIEQVNIVMRYQALKRKLMTEAQARKNTMIYLKNMARFNMSFFKGMTYNEIRPLFEKHYNSNQTFLERVEEDITVQEKKIEEERRKEKGRMAESQAKAYNLDLQYFEKFLSMQDIDEAEPAKVEEVLEVVTAAKLMIEVVTTVAHITATTQVPKDSAPRRRRGVVIQDPEDTAAASVIVHS
nr:hypothetical protein [Tanacetum cinerariifolium]